MMASEFPCFHISSIFKVYATSPRLHKFSSSWILCLFDESMQVVQKIRDSCMIAAFTFKNSIETCWGCKWMRSDNTQTI